jgi:hypothetical protein
MINFYVREMQDSLLLEGIFHTHFLQYSCSIKTQTQRSKTLVLTIFRTQQQPVKLVFDTQIADVETLTQVIISGNQGSGVDPSALPKG